MKTVRRIFYVVVIGLFFQGSLYPQLSDNFIKSIDELYKFKFLQIPTPQLMLEENNIIDSYKCWYKFLLCPEDNNENRNVLLSYGNKDIQSSSNSIYYWFFKIYFDQYKIRILLYDGEDFKAYKLGLKMIEDFYAIDTNNFDADEKLYYRFLAAAHNYFEGYAQSKYFFIRLMKTGDPELKMREGIKNLENIFKSNNLFLKTESCYLLMKIYKELETKSEFSNNYAQWLIQQYPQNVIFQIEYLTCISKNISENALISEKKNEINKLISTLPLSYREKKHLLLVVNNI